MKKSCIGLELETGAASWHVAGIDSTKYPQAIQLKDIARISHLVRCESMGEILSGTNTIKRRRI
jgi:hypothetical protein